MKYNNDVLTQSFLCFGL